MRIEKIMEREKVEYQKILVPKNGGLTAIDPYQSLGIDQRDESKYADSQTGIEIWRCRGEDIPQMCDYYTIERGIPVIGLTGDDLVDEYRLKQPFSNIRVLDTVDWINKPQTLGGRVVYPLYSRPTLCLIGRVGSGVDQLCENSVVIVNSFYEFQSRMYLADLTRDKGFEISNIRIVRGELENEIPFNAEFGVEIVLTGKTLTYLDKGCTIQREPPLRVLKEFRQSDFSVVSSWPSGRDVVPSCIDSSGSDVLQAQYEQICSRKAAPTESLTSSLLQDRNSYLKKVGEETMEFIAAYLAGSLEDLLTEAQQVVWLVQTGLVNRGIRWGSLIERIKSVSG